MLHISTDADSCPAFQRLGAVIHSDTTAWLCFVGETTGAGESPTRWIPAVTNRLRVCVRVCVCVCVCACVCGEH